MSHFTPRFFCRVILLCVSTDFVIGVDVAAKRRGSDVTRPRGQVICILWVQCPG